MRAVRFHRHGSPDVLSLDHVSEPRPPSGDELLVRVVASSVNGTDLGLRRGDLKVATWGRLPFTLGFDVAGVVLACGPQVTAFAPGDRVMALLGHGGGGQADQVLIRQSRAALAPRTVSLVQAAALPLAGLTALQALQGKAMLRSRPAPAQVLVIGASGGIGSYAVQLAKRAGAHVTGTASTAKLAFVAGLGADEVIDHSSTPLADLAGRWDVVLDSPGLHRMSQLGRLLTHTGVLVSTRPLSLDAVVSLAPERLRRSGPSFAGVMTKARSQDLAHLAALVDGGLLTSPVSTVLSLDDAAAAHRAAEGGAPGKVVLTLEDRLP